MLARYKMFRGPRPPDDPMPRGIRRDSRYKTKHCLRPAKEDVDEYLADPNDEAWRQFKKKYLMLLETRFASDRTLFDELAEQARADDVWLGCSCPTKMNPNVYHCHTVLALEFMKEKFPDLDVVFPPRSSNA